jgi:hypothetical protein
VNNADLQLYGDHDYYIDRGAEPPRFAQYRLARAKHKLGDTKTYQDVWDSITQDELDYYLKAQLKVSPDQRYQSIKKEWYFHKSSWYMRDQSKGYDGHGCNNGQCVPECRYYPEYRRIEDEEVIAAHNKWVESYRQRNAIVEPSTLLEQQHDDDESDQP